ncbi:MAG: Uncharacterized protein CEN87_507 [Parcubacteria group bacterium Licking1014_1]|nr:MAG: Uncharacterized protein CEN87_507 [Parcubacteria group bacterium Licking1014_1]
MSKKIYDIFPPKLARKIKDGAKEFLGDGKRKHRGRREKKKKFLWKPVLAVAGIFLIILVAYLFYKLPKAEVAIWPKTEILSFKEIIIADKSVDSVDLNAKIIPAKYLQEEINSSQEFLATGNASNEGKASGTITIYNKCDPLGLIILKVGTHFLSDSNKYFITLSKVAVPAAKKNGGKITHSSVAVKVEATEGGEEYNIKPANFSAPKLAGSPYYYCIYAKSEKAMSGGFASAVKKVTDSDIQAAKDIVNKKLLSDIKNSIKNKISSDYILLDNAISSEVISGSSDAKSGIVSEKFNYQAKARAEYLIFKKSDLDKFAKNYIISQMPDSKNLLEESFNITYNSETVDIEGGKITLDTEFSAKIYFGIDKNSLMSLFRNKTGAQMNEIINDSLGDRISRVKINLWPFWAAKAPKNQKMIKIELKFD